MAHLRRPMFVFYIVDGCQDRFKLHWKESGGPPVKAPSRKSFGSGLIEQ